MCVLGEEGGRRGNAVEAPIETDSLTSQITASALQIQGSGEKRRKDSKAKSDSKYEVVSGKRECMREAWCITRGKLAGITRTHKSSEISDNAMPDGDTHTHTHTHNTDTDTPIEERGVVSSLDKLSAPSPSDSTTIRKSEEGYINIVVH